MHSHIIYAADGVADTSVLPVEVFMKSTPASIAMKDATAMFSGVTSKPVSSMALSITVRPCDAEHVVTVHNVVLQTARADDDFLQGHGERRETDVA